MNLREIYQKDRVRLGQEGQAAEEPTLYYLSEVQVLRGRTYEDLSEIHRAKLAFPGQRVIQEGPEMPRDRPHQSNL